MDRARGYDAGRGGKGLFGRLGGVGPRSSARASCPKARGHMQQRDARHMMKHDTRSRAGWLSRRRRDLQGWEALRQSEELGRRRPALRTRRRRHTGKRFGDRTTRIHTLDSPRGDDTRREVRRLWSREGDRLNNKQKQKKVPGDDNHSEAPRPWRGEMK